MRYELTDYQLQATRDVVDDARTSAAAYRERGRTTALGLTAPTGAGKTVIAAAVLEDLMFGTDEVEPNRNLAVLWLTDDPALNAQTSHKMLAASSRLTDRHLVMVDNTFDEPSFAPGRIYFCHIQQLGKGSTSYHGTIVADDGAATSSDRRTHGLWETIANTVGTLGADFLVVRDEAHRGTGTSTQGNQTIVSIVVHGGTTPVGTTQPPAPVVLGVSATPKRFTDSMTAEGSAGDASRALRVIGVDVAAVRRSGMVKDHILVHHLGEAQVAEDTLLVEAAEKLIASDAAWQAHHAATGDSLVEPILVIQVPPAVSMTKINGILDTLQTTWPILTDEAIAHSFGEHVALRVGTQTVRYLSPDAINDDDRVRVVLFKDALTTGWDCPRAEVMLSLRAAEDYTNIAQLIGRMVRTPLAKRIDTDYRLNDVDMYLPYYDLDNVDRVVAALQHETVAPPEVVINPVDCPRNPDVPDEAFAILTKLPSSARPPRTYRSNVARLVALAALLADADLEKRPTATVKSRMNGAVRTEDETNSEKIDQQVNDNMHLLITQKTIAGGTFVLADDADDESASTSRQVTQRDLTDAFNRARRLLPDAVADWYYQYLCDEQGMEDDEARARVAALSTQQSVIASVEAAAKDQIAAWRNKYFSHVQRSFPSANRQEFEAVWQPAVGDLMPVIIDIPDALRTATEKLTTSKATTGRVRTLTPLPLYPRHIFALPVSHAESGQYPVALGSRWEQRVLTEELTYSTLVGWYRNPSSGQQALAISYDDTGKKGLLHPDFIFFHAVEGEDVQVDIVDPHQHQSSDTGPKWAGLARWAQTNSKVVRRAVAVIEMAENLCSLDLTRPGIAERLDKTTSKNQVEALFLELGTDY